MDNEFRPKIESVSSYLRQCNCGRNHEIEIIRGTLHYAKANETIFCAGLLEHQNEKHIWLSFITGEWPNTNQPDCCVTIHVWVSNGEQIMRIESGSSSPFNAEDIFECYPVTREQVLAVNGAKEWAVKVYLLLFELENKIGTYLQEENA
jgi:hypothetical protein